MPTKKNQQPKIKATDDPDRDPTGKFVKGNQRAAKPGEVRNPSGKPKRFEAFLSDAIARKLTDIIEGGDRTFASAIADQFIAKLYRQLLDEGLTAVTLKGITEARDTTEGRPQQKVLVGNATPTDPAKRVDLVRELLARALERSAGEFNGA